MTIQIFVLLIYQFLLLSWNAVLRPKSLILDILKPCGQCKSLLEASVDPDPLYDPDNALQMAVEVVAFNNDN